MFGRFDNASDWLANEDRKRRLILNPVTSADYKAIYMKRQRSSSEIKSRERAAKRLRASKGNAPIRAYPRSMVPTASYGYRPNTFERKAFDIDTNTAQVNTTGDITLLSLPRLGSDINNRIGRKITTTSIFIRGFVRVQSTLNTNFVSPLAGSSQLCRFILFVDYQPNGVLPTVAQVLKESLPSSQLNINSRDRFKILKDKTWAFDPVVYNTTATQAVCSFNRTIIPFKCYKKCKIETVFNADAGSVADITTGAICMLVIGSTGSANDDANFVVSTRCRYIDI